MHTINNIAAIHVALECSVYYMQTTCRQAVRQDDGMSKPGVHTYTYTSIISHCNDITAMICSPQRGQHPFALSCRGFAWRCYEREVVMHLGTIACSRYARLEQRRGCSRRRHACRLL